MDKQSKIYVAGHTGMVGSAIVRKLKSEGYENLLLRTHDELDLTDKEATQEFLRTERPEYIFMAAGRVGGIEANIKYNAEFLEENWSIASNVIYGSCLFVKRLLFLGSACVYPRDCPQPIREEYLLTGPLESSNEGYALAKISAVGICRALNYQGAWNFKRFITAMPSNLYGPGDNFESNRSHVIPGIMIKMLNHLLFSWDYRLELMGTGNALREFTYVDDLADALLILMKNKDAPLICNIGSGDEFTISQLAQIISIVLELPILYRFGHDGPDGTPRKLLDSSIIRSMGWTPTTTLEEGLKRTYAWYLEHQNELLL